MSKSAVDHKLKEACERRGMLFERVATDDYEERKRLTKANEKRMRLKGVGRKPFLLGLQEFGE